MSYISRKFTPGEFRRLPVLKLTPLPDDPINVWLSEGLAQQLQQRLEHEDVVYYMTRQDNLVCIEAGKIYRKEQLKY
jgi:hypothetical protein